MRWLFPHGGKGMIKGYRVASCCLIVLGAILPVSSLWELADFCGAFLVFFNVIALLGLSKYVAFVLKDYQKKRETQAHPCWDYETDVIVQYENRKDGFFETAAEWCGGKALRL